MISFETEKSYFIKNDLYYLEFECVTCDELRACFKLVKIETKADFSKCPILFNILQDFYTHFDNKSLSIYTTNIDVKGPIRQVVFSDYQNYLWIDSLNEVGTNDLNKISIDRLNLSIRPYNCLTHELVYTLGDIKERFVKLSDLLIVRNLDIKAANEIVEKVKGYGIIIKNDSNLNNK